MKELDTIEFLLFVVPVLVVVAVIALALVEISEATFNIANIFIDAKDINSTK